MKASLEDEVRRLRALEGEVEKLRMQGKDAAAHEQEVRQLREELKEKYLLEQEVKKLRTLEGEISRMKAQGQDATCVVRPLYCHPLLLFRRTCCPFPGPVVSNHCFFHAHKCTHLTVWQWPGGGSQAAS
jgi:hypothetical protein